MDMKTKFSNDDYYDGNTHTHTQTLNKQIFVKQN